MIEVQEEKIDQPKASNQEKRILRSYERIYPEDVFRLRSKHFGKKLLQPFGEEAAEYSYGDTDKKVKGKSGNFVLYALGYGLRVYYSINLSCLPPKLELLYKKEGDYSPGTNQTINLEVEQSGAGLKWFMLCPRCNRRCRVLYRTGVGNLFGCRICKDIKYSLCYINKKTKAGAYLYYINRLTSLFDPDNKPKRPFYNGKLTNQLQRMERKYKKWGLQIPKELRDLMEIEFLLNIEKMDNDIKTAETLANAE